MKTCNETTMSKWKEIKIGNQVVLVSEIKNGLVNLKPFDKGKIVYLQGQNKASVWFRNIGHFKTDPVAKALDLDISFHKNGKLDGVVIELVRSSFAVKYFHNDDFDCLVVNEDDAFKIPFFVKDNVHIFSSATRKDTDNGKFETIHQYYLNDIINIVSDGFKKWVEETLEVKKIGKNERESGDFPEHWDFYLSNEPVELFYKKKRELELAFAKATGIYYEFTGGLLFD